MTETEKPATGSGDGLRNLSSGLHRRRQPSHSPNQDPPQAKSRARLRLVAIAPRPRLIDVRLTAIAGLYPYGGVTRSFQLTYDGLKRLIAVAERMEAMG